MTEPERRQHPVLAGLTALVGVGLAIGLLFAAGALAATRVLGFGEDAVTAESTAKESMYLPKPEKTTPSTPSAPATQTSSAPPSDTSSPSEQTGISLTAGQTAVAPMARIDLTGSYPGGDGAVLQVQRATGAADDWVDFPVTVTVNGGQFSTYVQTGKTGENRFRVVDTDTDQMSNEVSVTVG